MPIINPTSIAFLPQKDAIFLEIHGLYGEPPNWQREAGFETLLRIILEQQVSLESAFAAYQQLKQRVKNITPTAILALSDETLRACYFSRQKTKYARALAEAILNKTLDLNRLNQLSVEEVYVQLTQVKGIGKWTAEIYMMFCLEKPDLFPPGDIAAINTIKEWTGVKNKEEAIAYAESWAPYRTAATFYLWYYYLCKRGRKVVY